MSFTETVSVLRELNVHTSDRISFKRCRRKWHWGSPLRLALRPKTQKRPLWFGTGWHFVLEDFHGNREYGSPREALDDYVQATLEYFGEEHMPDNWRDLHMTGQAMADYYVEWLKDRDPLETYYVDGIPQCEVNAKIRLPVSQAILDRLNVDVVYYNMTVDRICVSPYGTLAIGEYKTAAQIFQAHYLIDPQIGAYSWGAQILYDQPIEGVYYYQFKKAIAEEPDILKSGRVSCNRNMGTTYLKYREVLRRMYGSEESAPAENIHFLNYLAGLETPEGDKFIMRDYIRRNAHSLESEGVKIMLEVEDMLNPDLPLYPNPTRECVQYTCDFFDPCVGVDDGDDWAAILEDEYICQREYHSDPWRALLKRNKPYKELLLDTPPESLISAAAIASKIRNAPQDFLSTEDRAKLQLGL